MTRIEFFFNVADKLEKTADLCEKAWDKGRKLTVFTQSIEMNMGLQRQLWGRSAQSFLPSSTPEDTSSQFSPIVLDAQGDVLLQDDILVNLQMITPPFFSRFKVLIELVGMEEADKVAARERFKFYRDRGYAVKSTDAIKS